MKYIEIMKIKKRYAVCINAKTGFFMLELMASLVLIALTSSIISLWVLSLQKRYNNVKKKQYLLMERNKIIDKRDLKLKDLDQHSFKVMQPVVNISGLYSFEQPIPSFKLYVIKDSVSKEEFFIGAYNEQVVSRSFFYH